MMRTIVESTNKWLGAILCLAFLLLTAACHDPVIKPVRAYSKDVAYYTAEGGVIIWRGDKHCVAPPAQAARLSDIEAAGKIAAQSGSSVTLGAEGAASIDREVAQLYSQGQGNLFLQFALYRLCEMHLNDAIDGAEYVDLYEKVLRLAKELVEAEKILETERQKTLELQLKKERYRD
ncbi:MAG: hypothetical protein GY854_33180 [Deltaproteobacteria bacterium]|nr:hypothetical protein [Deltaproteobacteria bacterium]